MNIFSLVVSRCLPVIFLALLFSAPVQAEKFRVFTEPLAPVHYEEKGVIKGIATEVVSEIFKEAGGEPLFEIYPWKRAYQKTLKTEGSFIFTINRTEKREGLFKWVGPILPKTTYLYKLKERNDIQVKNYDDLKRYTTAVILGHSLTTRLLDMGFREGKELITTPNKKVQIKVFLKGRCDLITGNRYTIHESLKSEGFSTADIEPALLITASGYYLGANIDTDDELIERLNEANQRVQNSGIIDEIIRKYLQ